MDAPRPVATAVRVYSSWRSPCGTWQGATSPIFNDLHILFSLLMVLWIGPVIDSICYIVLLFLLNNWCVCCQITTSLCRFRPCSWPLRVLLSKAWAMHTAVGRRKWSGSGATRAMNQLCNYFGCLVFITICDLIECHPIYCPSCGFYILVLGSFNCSLPLLRMGLCCLWSQVPSILTPHLDLYLSSAWQPLFRTAPSALLLFQGRGTTCEPKSVESDYGKVSIFNLNRN